MLTFNSSTSFPTSCSHTHASFCLPYTWHAQCYKVLYTTRLICNSNSVPGIHFYFKLSAFWIWLHSLVHIATCTCVQWVSYHRRQFYTSTYLMYTISPVTRVQIEIFACLCHNCLNHTALEKRKCAYIYSCGM